MKKSELDLIPDPDMFVFFEKSTRGGTYYTSNRKSRASNKYLKSYDPKQESNLIIYLYANNLYGYTVSKFLSTSGFKWINPKDFDLNTYTSNSSKRCVHEFGLDYPKDFRELQNIFPLAPDKAEIR